MCDVQSKSEVKHWKKVEAQGTCEKGGEGAVTF